MDRKDSK